MTYAGQAGISPPPCAPRQGGLGTSPFSSSGDARAALPGLGEILVAVGVCISGVYLVSKFFDMFFSRDDTVSNPRCPLASELYGGLPNSGGFGSSTEYEIGAQRIAEAAHCILGSLGSVVTPSSVRPELSWRHSLHYEVEHLLEETEIIAWSLKEYSRPLYNERIVPSYIEAHTEESQLLAKLRYSIKTVESIRSAAPALAVLAESKLSALDEESIPEPVYKVATRAYRVVIELSRAMLESVMDYPESVSNAYRDHELGLQVALLQISVRNLVDEAKAWDTRS